MNSVLGYGFASLAGIFFIEGVLILVGKRG